MDDARNREQRLTFSAPDDRASEIVLEPWGEQHHVSAGEEIEIVAEGPAGGAFEVELEFEGDLPRLSIWAWQGATARVEQNPTRSPDAVSARAGR